MRIVTVVGVQKSGKTSTIVSLIEAIRARGKKVGTCISAVSPTFTIGHSVSGIMRHRRAGSELVCSRAKGETAFLYPEELPLSRVLTAYEGCDYVLLEGDYYAAVPRIVCAHTEEDLALRMNRRTIAISGRISEKGLELPFPCINALTDADALLDQIDRMVPDIVPCALLDEKLPPVLGVTDEEFVQYGCPKSEAEQAGRVQITVDGKPLTLSNQQLEQVLAWAKETQNA